GGRGGEVVGARGGDLAAQAAKGATSTTPVVFTSGDDAVATGLVASLARPGGNLTGFAFLVVELHPKRVELMSELVPLAKVMDLLVNPGSPQTDRVIRTMQEASRAKGIQLRILKAGTEIEIGTAFDSVVQEPVGALVVQADPFFVNRRQQFAAL